MGSDSHVGSAESGLLENFLLLFRASKSNKSSEYQTEMNWFVFSDWCESKVFPAMKKTKKKSVCILDGAICHIFLDDEYKRPATSWNKTRLADSIARWECMPDDWPLTWRVKKTNNELLKRAREINPMPAYKIQRIATKFNERDFQIKILFLPVARPELNPIDMLWPKIKREVATKNLNFRLPTVEEITKQAVLK